MSAGGWNGLRGVLGFHLRPHPGFQCGSECAESSACGIQGQCKGAGGCDGIWGVLGLHLRSQSVSDDLGFIAAQDTYMVVSGLCG